MFSKHSEKLIVDAPSIAHILAYVVRNNRERNDKDKICIVPAIMRGGADFKLAPLAHFLPARLTRLRIASL